MSDGTELPQWPTNGASHDYVRTGTSQFQEVTITTSEPPPAIEVNAEPWRPSIPYVHAFIPVRPQFSPRSRPSAHEVDDIIASCTDSLKAEINVAEMPAPLVGKAKLVVGLHAASQIEMSYFPEQQLGEAAPAAMLYQRYQDELYGLRQILSGYGIGFDIGPEGVTVGRGLVSIGLRHNFVAYPPDDPDDELPTL